MRKLMAFALLLSLFAGCKKDDDKDYGPIDEKIITDSLAANNIDAQRDPSGLYYKIINAGSGNVPAFAYVTLFYKGYLTNGQVFDQTKSEAVTFNLGRLIPGWQIGIPKVGKGGKIQLFVPSALGYGGRATGSIPANSVLIFEVDVVNY